MAKLAVLCFFRFSIPTAAALLADLRFVRISSQPWSLDGNRFDEIGFRASDHAL